MLKEFFDIKTEAFGIDISDLSIKAVQIEKGEIVSYGKIWLREGLIKKGQVKDPKALAFAIQQLLAKIKGKKIKTKYVIASLPEERSFIQVTPLPKLSEKEAKEAARFEAENYIPYALEKVYLDAQIVPPLYNHLDHTDVLLAAIPREIVEGYLKVLHLASLKPIAFEIESQSVVRALIPEETTTRPVLILDIGATRTGFAIFAGKSLRFTTSLPISSEKFTRALIRTLKIDYQTAQDLKYEYGVMQRGKEGEVVFEALIPVLTDFVEQIKQYIEYYQTHASHLHLPPNGKNFIQEIILCGGGAEMKGLDKFLASQLKIPTKKGNPLVNLRKQKSIIPQSEILSYACAIGLALRSYQEKWI